MSCSKISMLLLLISLLLPDPAVADVYTLFNYHNSSVVYRLDSTQGSEQFSAKIITTQPAMAMHIDKNNRLKISHKKQGAYNSTPRRLYRQVFDGLPVFADFGVQGFSQHQDQRDSVLPGHSGRPVFRSRGAPFSPGPGFMVSQQVAQQNIMSGETKVFSGRNWYEIPNSSWYQTWIPAGISGHPSYLICYDCWQERPGSIYDSVWNGIEDKMVEEMPVADVYDYRLLRATVDGAMEIVSGASEPAIILSLPVSQAICHKQEEASGQVETLVYSWYANAAGAIFSGTLTHNCQIVAESKHARKRFPLLYNGNRLLVMGTDILRSWLQAAGLSAADSECTLCAIVPDADRGHALFVYSAPDNLLYRFYLRNNNTVDYHKISVTEPPVPPVAMAVDQTGSLLLGAFSVWPQTMSGPENILMSVEAVNHRSATSDAKSFVGDLILAQNVYFNIFRATAQQPEPSWQSRHVMGRHFYQCEFVLSEKPQKLPNDVRELIKLAGQQGNRLGVVRRTEEHEHPGQFIMPGQVFMTSTR